MDKYKKVIKGLECCSMKSLPKCEVCPYANTKEGTCFTMDKMHRDALALLKAQEPATIEPKRIELADETKAWLDKMDAVDALGNIADICIDWDGYRTADGLGGLINEIWAYARYCATKFAKAQEPVKPEISGNTNGEMTMVNHSFQEVMRQWKRMCHSYENCQDCPLGGRCGVMQVINASEVFEPVVTLWAAEHPEPVYPTWFEWLDSIGVIGSKIMETRISADIAKRLEIEPKEK